MGYSGTTSNARQYISSIAREYGLEMAKYSNASPEIEEITAVGKKPKFDYITPGKVSSTTFAWNWNLRNGTMSSLAEISCIMGSRTMYSAVPGNLRKKKHAASLQIY